MSNLIFFFFLLTLSTIRSADAGAKRRIHISDDLDDVVDDEEDDDWRQWGNKSPPSDHDFDPPPSDFSSMDLPQIQADMMKRQTGPVFGFVKLRLGVKRTSATNFQGNELDSLRLREKLGLNFVYLKSFEFFG